jgi:hypothetical protein
MRRVMARTSPVIGVTVQGALDLNTELRNVLNGGNSALKLLNDGN